MSIFDTFIICRKCGITRICFDDSQRGPTGNLIPLCYETKEIHSCDLSETFPCSHCDEQIYLDRKVLSPTGKRISLNALDGKYHYCNRNERTAEELFFFKQKAHEE